MSGLIWINLDENFGIHNFGIQNFGIQNSRIQNLGDSERIRKVRRKNQKREGGELEKRGGRIRKRRGKNERREEEELKK